jgi:hypothetical protein
MIYIRLHNGQLLLYIDPVHKNLSQTKDLIEFFLVLFDSVAKNTALQDR